MSAREELLDRMAKELRYFAGRTENASIAGNLVAEYDAIPAAPAVAHVPADFLNYIMQPQTIRLHMGELTNKELKLVQSVIQWTVREYEKRPAVAPASAVDWKAIAVRLFTSIHLTGYTERDFLEAMAAKQEYEAALAAPSDAQRPEWEKFDDDLPDNCEPVPPEECERIREMLKADAQPAQAVTDRLNTHQCPDWDYMVIRPTDPEWEACTCDKSKPPERARSAQEGETK